MQGEGVSEIDVGDSKWVETGYCWFAVKVYILPGNLLYKSCRSCIKPKTFVEVILKYNLKSATVTLASLFCILAKQIPLMKTGKFLPYYFPKNCDFSFSFDKILIRFHDIFFSV